MKSIRGCALGTVAVGVSLLLLALPSSAEIHRADLSVPGDGRVVRDTESGLDWLRLHETAGVNMASILSGHGGWIASGWRYATRSETCEMLAHVFDVEATPECAFVGEGTGEFLALFGVLDVQTYPSGLAHASWAYYLDDDPGDPLEGRLEAIRFWQFGTLELEGASTRENTILPNDPWLPSSTGSLLVRASPAAVPALGALGRLLVAGCVGAGGAAWVRRRR